MITFQSKGDDIICSVDAKLHGENNRIYNFKFSLNDPATAQIVSNHLHSKLSELIADIRKTAYNEGHRRAKAKEKKLNNFNGVLKDSAYIGY